MYPQSLHASYWNVSFASKMLDLSSRACSEYSLMSIWIWPHAHLSLQNSCEGGSYAEVLRRRSNGKGRGRGRGEGDDDDDDDEEEEVVLVDLRATKHAAAAFAWEWEARLIQCLSTMWMRKLKARWPRRRIGVVEEERDGIWCVDRLDEGATAENPKFATGPT